MGTQETIFSLDTPEKCGISDYFPSNLLKRSDIHAYYRTRLGVHTLMRFLYLSFRKGKYVIKSTKKAS